MGAILVFPPVMLVVGQGIGVVYLNLSLVLLGLILWVLLDLVLLWWGSHMFRRAELFSRLVRCCDIGGMHVGRSPRLW